MKLTCGCIHSYVSCLCWGQSKTLDVLLMVGFLGRGEGERALVTEHVWCRSLKRSRPVQKDTHFVIYKYTQAVLGVVQCQKHIQGHSGVHHTTRSRQSGMTAGFKPAMQNINFKMYILNVRFSKVVTAVINYLECRNLLTGHNVC